jgi:large subunit ribosomal protein L17
MNHRKKGRNFSRTSSHRKAMFKNMSCSLIEHDSIVTTLEKAKELRTYFEPLVTLAKVNNHQNRRRAYNILRNKKAVSELFERIATKNADRPGGYLRVLKKGYRSGDNAPMALVRFSEGSIYDYGQEAES